MSYLVCQMSIQIDKKNVWLKLTVNYEVSCNGVKITLRLINFGFPAIEFKSYVSSKLFQNALHYYFWHFLKNIDFFLKSILDIPLDLFCLHFFEKFYKFELENFHFDSWVHALEN